MQGGLQQTWKGPGKQKREEKKTHRRITMSKSHYHAVTVSHGSAVTALLLG